MSVASNTWHIITICMHKHSIIKYGTHSLECRSTYITTKKHICNINTGTNWAKHKTSLPARHYWWPTIRHYSLAVDHKIDHRYPKLLKISLLNTENNTVQIPWKPIIGNLQSIEVEDFEISNISWTTEGTADTTNIPTELPSMLPESSVQPEHNNAKHSIVLLDAKIPQEAKNGLSSLHEGDYNSIISNTPMDVGRTNLFQMDIQTAEPPLHANCTLFH